MYSAVATYLKLATILLAVTFSGCATLDGPPNPDDPYESFNRSMHGFNETLDEYILEPVAKGYQAVTPDPVDKGITNFFSNLDDVVVLINDILQLKFKQAVSDFWRIVINSTVGLFGLIDVASSMDLEKHNEDFGQTLGYWGVDSGPYLVLPFFGPSSVRDGIGFAVDTLEFDPIPDEIDKSSTELTAYSVKYIDKRADLLSASRVLEETPDEYAFIRDAWVSRRKNLVYDGNPPEQATRKDDLSEDELFADDLVLPPEK